MKEFFMNDKKKKGNGIFKEFVAFINKGNALALAIGVIIGGAFSAIVTAINKNIISPIIACLVGNTNLSDSLLTPLKKHALADATTEELAQVLNGTLTVHEKNGVEYIYDIYISWGAFIQAVIDFLLIAIILFAIVKIISSIAKHAKAAAEKHHHKEEVEVAEEVPAPAPVEDPDDVKLLKEIRDLLKETKSEK